MILIKKSFFNFLLFLNYLLFKQENVNNILYDNYYYYHIILFVYTLNLLYYLIFVNIIL